MIEKKYRILNFFFFLIVGLWHKRAGFFCYCVCGVICSQYFVLFQFVLFLLSSGVSEPMKRRKNDSELFFTALKHTHIIIVMLMIHFFFNLIDKMMKIQDFLLQRSNVNQNFKIQFFTLFTSHCVCVCDICDVFKLKIQATILICVF